MTYPRAHVTALACLALMLVSCGRFVHTTSAPPPPRPLPINVLYCRPWTAACESCAGVTASREVTRDLEDIDVIIHVMSATLGEVRPREYSRQPAWAVAPTEDALTTGVEVTVAPGQPPVWVEYWTPRMVELFFGKDGKVNEIWTRHHIRLILRGVENCHYRPEALRPDGLIRDSMPTPQTSTPWTGSMFRGINRLFTEEHPRALHVFFWWSLAEGDIDGRNWVQGVMEPSWGGNGVWGYSRSAARGGAAVWVGSSGCFQQSTKFDYLGLCAKVLAHEIGHALGLQHVDDESNLMYKDALARYRDDKRSETLTPSQGEQARREAREQFGSK